jgi:hypothetical protein
MSFFDNKLKSKESGVELDPSIFELRKESEKCKK